MKDTNTQWAIVIQARTGSTRLANKMVLPFYDGKSIFQIVIETLIAVFPKEKIILATTINPKDDVLISTAASYDIKSYRGSEDDVLSRFVDVVNTYQIDAVLRICADNPFFIKQNLIDLMQKGATSSADYVAYFFKDNLPTIRSHSGFFGEWVKASALKEAALRTSDKFYHEHVTNFIYGHEDIFSIEKHRMPEEEFCRKVRLTIDTQEDFDMAKEIYALFAPSEEISIEGLKQITEAHPTYLLKMQKIIEQYAK